MQLLLNKILSFNVHFLFMLVYNLGGYREPASFKGDGTFEDFDNLNASISKLRAETPSRAGDSQISTNLKC